MTKGADFKLPLNAEDIQKILPHRYPFLMVDKVIEIGPGLKIKALKAVGQNEPWFQGHFPGRPVMPGVMMVESLAQAGAIMVLMRPEHVGKFAMLASITSVRFRRVVLPGDLMTIDVEVRSIRMGIGKASGTITVDGEVAVEGELRFALQNSGSG